jgi:hypothetical protein
VGGGRAEDQGDAVSNFDATKQREIPDIFASIAGDSLDHKTNIGRLLVIFSSFESVVRMEANWHVSDDDIEQLKETLSRPDLWKVRRGFENVTGPAPFPWTVFSLSF